jgi:hypothetical protein
VKLWLAWKETTRVFKKRRRPLVEYIFVDVQRLESYISQIEGMVKYDRVPTWSAGLSITGPTVDASLQKAARKWTYHEMIIHLLDYLKKTKQLDTERESVAFRTEVLFCLETCVARKALLPSDVIAEIPGIKELALWISCEPEKTLTREKQGHFAGTLYLIESYFEDDSPYVHAFTGYSAFEYMLRTLGPKTLMMDKSPRRKDVAELARRFALNPFEYLVGLKAQVSAPRRIECLYRRRATMIDLNIDRLVTFGYPIFIVDAT